MNYIPRLAVGGKTGLPLTDPLGYHLISPPTTAPKGQKRRWAKPEKIGRGGLADLPGQTYFPFLQPAPEQDMNHHE